MLRVESCHRSLQRKVDNKVGQILAENGERKDVQKYCARLCLRPAEKIRTEAEDKVHHRVDGHRRRFKGKISKIVFTEGR